jgi:hypothetical protein
MGYPKYDKSEAKRVYEESVARHRAESEEISRQAMRGVKQLLLAFAVMVISGVIILNTVNLQSETYTVTTRENVVVTKIIFPPGKSSGVVVEYYTVDDKTSGEFETREIWFSVGDTIPINISVEVEIKNTSK